MRPCVQEAPVNVGKGGGEMMRILLDAKDLIDIVEHSRPISIDDFRAWLRSSGMQAVLSFTNVNDFVGPTFANNSFLEMRLLLQKIETLPLSYIREGTIIANELREALAAYRENREPFQIDPFVKRWDETGFWENESAVKLLVGMRLDDLVYMARTTIQGYKRFNPGVREYLRDEQSIPKAERRTLKEIFVNRMPDRFAAHRLNTEGIDARSFGEWLWKNPLRSLGLRLFFEAHHMRLRDRSRPFEDGDIADFAHITALPYVDLLTVDKRIADLLSKVFKKIRSNHPQADLSQRVFAKVGNLLAQV
jgi:hypothetical protein